MTGEQRVSWRELESRVGLDDLPGFHRDFLRWRGVPDPEGMPLRRVQQRVEAELNRMVQADEATREDGDWRVERAVLAAFGRAAPYLER